MTMNPKYIFYKRLKLLNETHISFNKNVYFTKKVSVKNERRFDRPTVIFKFMIKSKISMCLYTIVRINEILTKSSKIFT